MRLLHAGDLRAQAHVGAEQRVGERDDAVAIVDRVGDGERVAGVGEVVARTVPKSSRMAWRGLLYESAVPLGRPLVSSSGPLASGQKDMYGRIARLRLTTGAYWPDAFGSRPWRACASALRSRC